MYEQNIGLALGATLTRVTGLVYFTPNSTDGNKTQEFKIDSGTNEAQEIQLHFVNDMSILITVSSDGESIKVDKYEGKLTSIDMDDLGRFEPLDMSQQSPWRNCVGQLLLSFGIIADTRSSIHAGIVLRFTTVEPVYLVNIGDDLWVLSNLPSNLELEELKSN